MRLRPAPDHPVVSPMLPELGVGRVSFGADVEQQLSSTLRIFRLD